MTPEFLEGSDLIASAGQKIRRLLDERDKLKPDIERHRERANKAQGRWENHEQIDCALKCAAEIEEVLGTRDPVVAARMLRALIKAVGAEKWEEIRVR